MNKPLTNAQIAALKTAEREGNAFAGRAVTHEGGAYRRMLLRLVERGLLTDRYRWSLTDAGRAAITGLDGSH